MSTSSITMHHRIQGIWKWNLKWLLDPSLPLLAIYTKNGLFQKVNTPLCSGSPLHKSKIWKHSLCPGTDDGIRKQISIYTMEADSAIRVCPKRTIGSHSVGKKHSHTKQNRSVRDPHPMGNSFSLESYKWQPWYFLQERNNWIAIERVLARWEGEVVGIPGIWEVIDPNTCPCSGLERYPAV